MNTGTISTQTSLRPFLARAIAAMLVSLWLGCYVAAGGLQGSLHSITFQGPITAARVTFTLYLPEGYDPAGARLPVIFHLHGMGGTHNGPHLDHVPASYESARAVGIIGPAILVFPDGYADSLWVDSATSNKPAETNVIKEILPYVDENYRTRAMRGGRAIQGFSMGGFGCLMHATKYPDLFVATVSYCGSIADWPTMLNIRPDLAVELFANSQARFQMFSPWWWSQQNAAVIRTGLGIRMVVGNIQSDLNTNRAFRNHLLSLGVTPDYIETSLPHDLPLQLAAEGANSWAFIASRLREPAPNPCPGDADGSRAIDFADVTSALANWGALHAGSDGTGDADHNGVVNFNDLTSVLAHFGATCL